jgi:hypothetical protein
MAPLPSSLAHGGGFVRMAAAEHAALSRLYLIPQQEQDEIRHGF